MADSGEFKIVDSPKRAQTERRVEGDRRRRHIKAFFYQFVNPRRRQHTRRASDLQAASVDFHDPILLVVVLLTISLCVVDVYATLALLQRGGVEVNPLMRALINRDTWLFYVTKYVVTAASLFVLLSFKNFRVYKKFSALHTLYGVLAIYIVLVIYQISLLSTAAA